MTKKHLEFCIYYMQTGDQGVAYKMAYPRASVKSLYASASRLMARPEVAEWVEGTQERVHKRLLRKFENEHYEKLKEQLLTIGEKRTVLTKIITGETKRIRYVKSKYGVQRVEEDLPVYAVLRAVDLDTRLENFYNYLTRSDTWRKAQNIYVNTPTLQQQVNILIAQTDEKGQPTTKSESLPPSELLSRAGLGEVGGAFAPDPPEGQNPQQTVSIQETSAPALHAKEQAPAFDENISPLKGDLCEGIPLGGVKPAQNTKHGQAPTPNKTPHCLTKLNKGGNTAPRSGGKKLPSPPNEVGGWRGGGGEVHVSGPK